MQKLGIPTRGATNWRTSGTTAPLGGSKQTLQEDQIPTTERLLVDPWPCRCLDSRGLNDRITMSMPQIGGDMSVPQGLVSFLLRDAKNAGVHFGPRSQHTAGTTSTQHQKKSHYPFLRPHHRRLVVLPEKFGVCRRNRKKKRTRKEPPGWTWLFCTSDLRETSFDGGGRRPPPEGKRSQDKAPALRSTLKPLRN